MVLRQKDYDKDSLRALNISTFQTALHQTSGINLAWPSVKSSGIFIYSSRWLQITLKKRLQNTVLVLRKIKNFMENYIITIVDSS